MKKFHIILFSAIITVFIGIIIITQNGSTNEKSKKVPTLPPDANTIKLISPTIPKPQVQGQQAQANDQAPVFGVEEGVKASYSAVIKTTKGDIAVLISGADAPRTVKNFLSKIANGSYKNTAFHRVEDWVVQGGDPKGDGTGGGVMITEINNLPFVTGSLGVAGVKRSDGAIISNDSQFFITKTNASWLNQQYTNFGIVTSGMDVVSSITKGDKILGITISQ